MYTRTHTQARTHAHTHTHNYTYSSTLLIQISSPVFRSLAAHNDLPIIFYKYLNTNNSTNPQIAQWIQFPDSKIKFNERQKILQH